MPRIFDNIDQPLLPALQQTTEEQPIIWLQNGAPPEPHRSLSA